MVIDKLQQPQAVAGEDGLFFGPLDSCEEVDGVGLFEFLSGLSVISTCPLRLSNIR